MKVIILTGLPGSGKSTVCEKWFPQYLRINQDSLGNRELCVRVAVAALEKNQDIIIDRVNFNEKQRKTWIDLALQYGAESVTSLVLDVPADECIARICSRKGHETISEDMPVDKKREIVYNFSKLFVMPSLDEGFNTVIIHKN